MQCACCADDSPTILGPTEDITHSYVVVIHKITAIEQPDNMISGCTFIDQSITWETQELPYVTGILDHPYPL